MRAGIASVTAVMIAVGAPAAHAAPRLVVRGAGYGHGIGMSQYGAFGLAQHGADHVAILSRYYTGTALGDAPVGYRVRVLLKTAVRISISNAARVVGGRKLSPRRTYRITTGAPGTVTLRTAGGRALGSYAAPLRIAGAPNGIRVLGRSGHLARNGRYRGRLELRPGAFGAVAAINAIGLEDYVRGVVSGESPASWPAAALEAQAIAARTYAITTSKTGDGFDQFPDTRSQVYSGISAEERSTDAAVLATRGRVVTYEGKPVVTYFFSTSGGRTENVENSFLGARPRPWLRSVEDPYDDTSPRHRWAVSLSLAEAKRRLGKLLLGELRAIKVLKRGQSPRVVGAEIVGTGGRTAVSGPELRRRLGLYDTWAFFSVTDAPEPPPALPSPPAAITGPTGTTAVASAPRCRRRSPLGSVREQCQTGNASVDACLCSGG